MAVASTTKPTDISAYGKTNDAKVADNIEGVTADNTDLTTKIVKGSIGTDNKVIVSWE